MYTHTHTHTQKKSFFQEKILELEKKILEKGEEIIKNKENEGLAASIFKKIDQNKKKSNGKTDFYNRTPSEDVLKELGLTEEEFIEKNCIGFRKAKADLEVLPEEIEKDMIYDLNNIKLDDELLEALDDPEKKDKFRIKAQKLLLTYKHHLDKELMEQFLCDVFKVKKLKKLYIAHENGEGDSVTPYEHTHIVLDIGKTTDRTGSRFLDVDYTNEDGTEEKIHPHIRIIGAVASWRRACNYITKEDKSVKLAPEDESNLVDRIWKHNTLADAYRDLLDFYGINSVVGIEKIFLQKKAEKKEISCAIKSIEEMIPVQRYLWEIMSKKPDDRTIEWIFDEKGNHGKSQMVRWLEINYPEKVLWIEGEGRATDLMYMIGKEIVENGWNGDTIVIDIPRSASTFSDIDQIYRVLEKVKDGRIFSTKYKGYKVMIEHPHVIVLSNKPPKESTMTGDRWNITTVEAPKEVVERRKRPGHVTLKYAPGALEYTITKTQKMDEEMDEENVVEKIKNGGFTPLMKTNDYPHVNTWKWEYEDDYADEL